YSATTVIEPFICARSRARSAVSPTSSTRISQGKQLYSPWRGVRAWPFRAQPSAILVHGPLTNSDVEVDRLVAAEHPELRAAANLIAEQPSEQLVRRGYRLAVERQQQIADEHAGLCGRSAARHADDQ